MEHPRVQTLRDAVDQLQRITDAAWLSSLDDRKRKELEFHDRDRDRSKRAAAANDKDTYERFYGNKKYYGTVSLSTRYKDDWLAREVPGKVFLDYACGNGANAIAAAQAGAALSLGLDISRVSVENARRDAAALGLSDKTLFFQADAENTKLPDGCVDVAICSGMLHHLDLSHAFPELRRILAPGGRILCFEALDYNPLIKAYRLLTPAMRTEWEKAHILSLKDLRYARRFFEVRNVRFWHVTSYAGAHVPGILPVLNALDALLTRLPLVQLMSWMFTFELRRAT